MDIDYLQCFKNGISSKDKRNIVLFGTCFILFVAVFVGVLGIAVPGANASFSIEDVGDSAADQEEEAQDTQNAITVFVCGSVNNPDVYELTAGSRVINAIDAANGFSDDANTQSLNLARILNDGEQIFVPSVNSNENVDNAYRMSGAQSESLGATRVNINTATAEQLDALPGIGPAIAQRIVAYRNSHGSFKSLEELKNVEGIGDKKYKALEDSILL